MGTIGTLADQLNIKIGSTEVQHLVATGALPGTTILFAAAKNGTGKGRLRIDAAGLISWRAPGSATFGTGQTGVTGTWLLRDGEEQGKWVRLQIWEDYLPVSPQEADVLLTNIYGEIAGDDCAAAQAAAGQVVTTTVILENVSTYTLTGLKVWLEGGGVVGGFRDLLSWLWKRPSRGSMSAIEISDDNITFVTPWNEADGLILSSIAAGKTITLYVRRTVTAGSSYDPAMAVELQVGFTGI